MTSYCLERFLYRLGVSPARDPRCAHLATSFGFDRITLPREVQQNIDMESYRIQPTLSLGSRCSATS